MANESHNLLFAVQVIWFVLCFLPKKINHKQEFVKNNKFGKWPAEILNKKKCFLRFISS
jgi:hypothetical protein